MSTVAARKKSIVSSTGIQIDTPVANNTLLNKAASQSTSLYQQCSSLRASLMRIQGFAQFFTLASTSSDSRQSTDPVTQLWDVFSLGIPLCHIFNKLQGFTPIQYEFDPETFDGSDRTRKHAIALFAMRIRQVQQEGLIEGCELFTVTDLTGRSSTDGLVKVINTVTAIVKRLPEDAFDASPATSPNGSSENLNPDGVPAVGKEAARNNVIREMVETERKYVQDLEIMQRYAKDLAFQNIVDQDTIHLLFPNLNKLLNFQRSFLIRFESTAESPWPDQRWGRDFIAAEEEFSVYEPYCANYTNATELMLANQRQLDTLTGSSISGTTELGAYLIKPVQRICKYPLLLDSLIKAVNPDEYPHYEELKAGSVAAKRITDKINESQRRAENEQTVKSLYHRVQDWKGHHLSNFGELLLDDIFVVTKSEVDREYHVFLFEKIILCCKEALPQPPNSAKKVSKNNSILKKQGLQPPPTPGGPGGSQSQKKTTPLLLKGRIFLNNVTQAVPVQASSRMSTASAASITYPLAVWWRGDDDLEFFTLRCRREDQMRQWEAQINRLIKEAAMRRASERGLSRIVVQNSTNPAHGRIFANGARLNGAPPAYSTDTAHLHGRSRLSTPYDDESSSSTTLTGTSSAYGGPQGYPSDGFEAEVDDDDYEDYPPASSYPASGRATPSGGRRVNALSMPPERDNVPGYDRPRAQTEDTNGPVMAQWRNNLPPPSGLATARPSRPTTPHLNSNSSVVSYTSDSSFGNGVRENGKQRPPLRSQFSSNKLRNGYDASGPESRSAKTNENGIPLPLSRSRSASQPSAYVPKVLPPPLPANAPWAMRSTTSVSTTSKRGSGGSSGSDSDSPNSSSPITPFGSSESSLGAMGIRSTRGEPYEVNGNGHIPLAPPVKVKVHFHEDIFVIQVPRGTEYNDLVEKVGRKIRLCGPRRDDGPLRVKYRDEDGDMISLGSTEDVQMAFEQFRPGGQVTLFVT